MPPHHRMGWRMRQRRRERTRGCRCGSAPPELVARVAWVRPEVPQRFQATPVAIWARGVPKGLASR
eukprot:10832512-Alexandrium_andersonii.AAC.1